MSNSSTPQLSASPSNPVLVETSPPDFKEAINRFGTFIGSFLNLKLEFSKLHKVKKGLTASANITLDDFYIECSIAFKQHRCYLSTSDGDYLAKGDITAWAKSVIECEVELEKFLNNIRYDLDAIKLEVADELARQEEEALRQKELEQTISQTLSSLNPAALAYLAGEGKNFLLKHVKEIAPKKEMSPKRPVKKVSRTR